MENPQSEQGARIEDKAVAGGARSSPARITSEELLGSTHELIIVHQGRDYRLRLTQNGKLILTA